MSDRPTVAAMRELREQLTEAEAELSAALQRAELRRVELEQLRLQLHPEADALARCIRALDAMVQAERSERQGDWRYAPAQLPAAERVLRHLAARYGVLWPEPDPPEVEPEPQSEWCPQCSHYHPPHH